MEPSSSDTGFFQQQPVVKNQFHDDVSLQRITKLFLPQPLQDQISPEATELGDEVLSQQIFDWVTDAEKSQPYLRGSGRDAFGKPRSELIVTEGWRKLQDFGFQKGFVALNYDSDYGPYNRLVQFIRCHLWEGSCANTLCPAAMQDGATRLLQRHLSNKTGLSPMERQVFQNAYDHLTSREPSKAWTSGQWMTERSGGSDVSRTETVATYDPYPESSPAPLADVNEKTPLGPWSISGFKWFSSATDSQMAILLAKTDPSKGVSAFLAPMRRHNPTLTSPTGQLGGSELNGVTIQRLKHKFGTQSLPTAELELKNMRAWLIGKEGHGIREISTMLNITRVHTTVSSVGYLGRALAIARGFAAVREAGLGRGRRLPLSAHPLHMRTLANLTTDYHGLMLLVYYTVSLLGLDEKKKPFPFPPPRPLTPPPETETKSGAGAGAALLRTLSSLHKSFVCFHITPLLHACMESLGGVGYLLNDESQPINVARLFRDACVGAIWEGTTDVLAGDTLRSLVGNGQGQQHTAGAGAGAAVEGLDWFVGTGLGLVEKKKKMKKMMDKGVEGVRTVWEGLRGRIVEGGTQEEELLGDARGLVFRLAEVLIAVLYMVDAAVHPGAEIDEMCARFLVKKGFVGEEEDGQGRKDLAMDQAIVYGAGKAPPATAGCKL
ncbi:acyl-CoA dehydrogenase/oxidase [Chaetomidium leptoderma]|uniref:Acyl-CoA dehydrogenase/oxidase n=1 Tax=Chaetomidium leptoderma TaxID=669021 RepID=A0AAN6VKP4_9PEZI|nr:acyl-CoA dehydrogenase/oxidase [Chaetomidium leptoderma]